MNNINLVYVVVIKTHLHGRMEIVGAEASGEMEVEQVIRMLLTGEEIANI